MKKTTLFLLLPFCLLFAEVETSLSTQSTEGTEFSRSTLEDARDRAIQAREEASNSLRDRASGIYNSRSGNEPHEKEATVVEKESSEGNQSISTQEVQSKESNSSTPKI